jgi:hypothetical protein
MDGEAFDAEVAAGWALAGEGGEAAENAVLGHFREMAGRYAAEPRMAFHLASALDFAGEEAAAIPLYEAAILADLPDDELAQALTQLGSSLRNVGRHADAVAVLSAARSRYPGDAAIAAFLALALSSAGHPVRAVRTLVATLVDEVDSPEVARYGRVLRLYAAGLGEPPGPGSGADSGEGPSEPARD